MLFIGGLLIGFSLGYATKLFFIKNKPIDNDEWLEVNGNIVTSSKKVGE